MFIYLPKILYISAFFYNMTQRKSCVCKDPCYLVTQNPRYHTVRGNNMIYEEKTICFFGVKTTAAPKGNGE